MGCHRFAASFLACADDDTNCLQHLLSDYAILPERSQAACAEADMHGHVVPALDTSPPLAVILASMLLDEQTLQNAILRVV